MNKKGYVLLSGGPDSTTLLYELVKTEKMPVTALFINFGQSFLDRELKCAKKIAKDLEVELDVISVPNLRYTFFAKGENKRSIIFRGTPEATYGIAAAYIRHNEGTHLWHANIAEDVDDIPNFNEFFINFQKSINALPQSDYFKIEGPYMNVRKAEVIKRGLKIGVPFEDTWSCLEGYKVHCGVCRSCVRRLEAFEKCGVKDPVKYLDLNDKSAISELTIENIKK